MKILFFTLMLSLAAGHAFSADCSYCGKADALKARFSQLKPDPMDEATIDEQDELVGQTEELIKQIVRGKKPSDADLVAVIHILKVAVPFDYSESLGESLAGTFKPYADRVYTLVRKEQKAKRLTRGQAEDVIMNLAIGENTVERGTDSQN